MRGEPYTKAIKFPNSHPLISSLKPDYDYDYGYVDLRNKIYDYADLTSDSVLHETLNSTRSIKKKPYRESFSIILKWKTQPVEK